MGRVFRRKIHAVDWPDKFGVRHHNISSDVLRYLSDDGGWTTVSSAYRPGDDSALYGDFPCGMVCGIHVDANAGYPYASHAEDAVYTEPSFSATDGANVSRYRNIDRNPVYPIWRLHWLGRSTRRILSVASADRIPLYGTGDRIKKYFCSEIRGVAVKAAGKGCRCLRPRHRRMP